MSLKVTVFTATYNRMNLLKKLYDSLVRQTSKDFEWIIVDDGSTDDTSTVVQQFLSENKLDISYIYQENGGKHRAVNEGLDRAKGQLFFIVDSDDALLPKAIATVIDRFTTIQDNPKYAGVAFNRGYSETVIVGETFEGEFIDCDNLHRVKYNILGDKAEVYRTEILKEIKFPEIEGENFMSEVVLWNEVARRGHKLRWFNEIIYISDYLEDGLTKNSTTIFKKNPIAHKMMTKELLQIDYPLKNKFGHIYKYHQIQQNSVQETARDLHISYIAVGIIVVMGKVKDLLKNSK